MKAILLSLALFAVTVVNAQQPADNRKFIEVKGSAEMSVQPDEIELQVVLGEYNDVYKENIEAIEASFKAVLKKNNIKESAVTFDNTSSWYWWYWWSYRNQNNSTRTVTVKLDNKTNIFKLVKDLDKKWTQSIRILSTTSKEMQRFRKEVKIAAMRAAKEKAAYLLESVGEQVGGILAVEEMPETTNDGWFYGSRQNLQSNSYIASTPTQNNGVDNVQEIKLRYEIKVKFEIK